jgi:hypothetical protein
MRGTYRWFLDCESTFASEAATRRGHKLWRVERTTPDQIYRSYQVGNRDIMWYVGVKLPKWVRRGIFDGDTFVTTCMVD